jgi:hypothetical protein
MKSRWHLTLQRLFVALTLQCMAEATAAAQSPSRPRLHFGGGVAVESLPNTSGTGGASLTFIGMTMPRGAIDANLVFASRGLNPMPFVRSGSSAKYVLLDLDFKVYLTSRKRAKPYLLTGTSWVDLNGKDALNVPRVITGDVGLGGWGLRLGGGLDFFASSHFVVTAGAAYRRLWLSSQIGLPQEETIADRLSGYVASGSFGVRVVF